MRISVSEAKGQLLDLVRRAEAGEDVILTRHGQEVVRLVPAFVRPTADERKRLLKEMFGVALPTDGVTAARSQDFLYDDAGLPR